MSDVEDAAAAYARDLYVRDVDGEVEERVARLERRLEQALDPHWGETELRPEQIQAAVDQGLAGMLRGGYLARGARASWSEEQGRWLDRRYSAEPRGSAMLVGGCGTVVAVIDL